MSRPTIFKRKDGSTLSTAKIIGRGGEGIIYAISTIPDMAIKIYNQNIMHTRKDKVISMVSKGWHVNNRLVTFPSEPVFNSNGEFAGYMMRLVYGYKPIHELYSPSGRKKFFPNAPYPFLVRAAANVARAFSSIHSLGCVIGDVNHSGVLVSPDATVIIIDSDSFQFNDGNVTFRCAVGVPEFTPPELQNSDLSNVIRNENHDNFGLAVLIFSILMMGRHPYDGVYAGSGEMERMRAISEARFAYSGDVARTNMRPPPNAPLLSDLPLPLADAFERAFGRTPLRPTAADWVGLLEAAERKIVQCSSNPLHHHFSVARQCRWCTIEAAFPGYQLFTGAGPIRPTVVSGLDAASLMQDLSAIQVPGQFDPAEVFVGQPMLPSKEALEVNAQLNRRYAVATGAIVAAGGAVIFFPAFWIFCVLGAAGAAFLANQPAPGFEGLQQKATSREDAWRADFSDYTKKTNSDIISQRKNEINEIFKQISGISNYETKLLSELKSQQRDIQLRQHLESFKINNASIEKITPQLKRTLRSFGIETAFDVSKQRVSNVPGFGEVRTGAMVDWRASINKRFLYDPNLPLNPSDVARVKHTVDSRRNALLIDARDRIGSTRSAIATILALRSNPPPLLMATFEEVLQSRADVSAVKSGFLRYIRKKIPVIVTCIALGWIGFLVYNAKIAPKLTRGATSPLVSKSNGAAPSLSGGASLAPAKTDSQTSPMTGSPNKAVSPSSEPQSNSKSEAPKAVVPATVGVSAPPFERPVPPTVTPNVVEVAAKAARAAAPPVSIDSPKPVSAPPATLSPLPPPVVVVSAPLPPPISGPSRDLLQIQQATDVQERLKVAGFFSGTADGVWGRQSRSALRDFRRANSLGSDDAWDVATEQKLFADGYLSGNTTKLGLPGPEAQYSPPGGASRNPLNRGDALWAQARLRELGYYSLSGDGVWGIGSREALRDFKVMNSLNNDDSWDRTTEAALSASYAIAAAKTFVGNWTTTPGSCVPNSSSMISISTQAAEGDGVTCRFQSFTQSAQGWRSLAICKNAEREWPATVELSVAGEKLIWKSGTGTGTYFKCRGP